MAKKNTPEWEYYKYSCESDFYDINRAYSGKVLEQNYQPTSFFRIIVAEDGTESLDPNFGDGWFSGLTHSDMWNELNKLSGTRTVFRISEEEETLLKLRGLWPKDG